MPILAGALFTKAIGYILNRTGGQILNRNSQPIVTRGSATGGGGGGGGTTDTGTESANLTFTDVVNGGSVYDSSNVGNKISINRKVTVNGSEDSSTANVEEILIYSHTIYYRNSFGNWFSKGSSSWTSVSGDPRMSSGGIRMRSARSIIDAVGFNVGPLGSGSGPTASQIVTALQFVGARWVRIPYKGGSVIGSGSSSPPQSDMSQLQSAIQSAGYTNPVLKVQFYADAQSTNANADLWTATQGPYVLSSLVTVRDGNGNPILKAIEGPNYMDTAASVTVDTTTTYSNSSNSTINSARLGWQQTINTWRSNNASALAGIPLVAPTYTNSTWYKQAGTGGTTTLDGNLNTANYADYGGYQLYMTNTLSASTGTTWTGQGMPCGSGNRGIDTAFDHGLQYMAAGTALTGTPNASLVQVEVDAPISGGSLSGYGTDGKAAAKANLTWFMDFLLLGGKRLFWFQLLGDSGNNSGAYGWYATDYSTARPSAICLHNLINLLSLNKSFGDNTSDTSAYAPAFDMTNLAVTVPSSPSTAGTSVATNFATAKVVKPGVLVIPKSDGKTMIAVWNEPSVQNSYGQSGALSPAADQVTVTLGTAYNYSLYDISGSGGSQTMSAATSTTAYATSTGKTATINLYGLPVIIELGSKIVESTSGTTVSAGSGGSIVDSSLESFTITGGNQIAVDGVTDTTTSAVTTLLYYNSEVWQYNGTDWYHKASAGATWQGPTTDPRSGSTTGVQALSSDGLLDTSGVVVHMTAGGIYQNSYSTWSAQLGALGIRHARDGAHVDDPAGTNSSNYVTWIKDLNSRFGIKWLFVTSPENTNSWSSSNNTSSSRAASAQKQANWLATTVGAAYLDGIEGMNEPDGAGSDQGNGNLDSKYLTWQQAIYSACRNISSLNNVTIYMPTILGESNITTAVNAGIKSYAEAGNAHCYQKGIVPEITGTNYNGPGYMKQQFFDPISTSKGGLWSECGYNDTKSPVTGVATDERSAAIYVPRSMLWNYKQGTPQISYKYEFLNEGTTSTEQTDREASFGFVRVDLSVKPAYTALKNLFDFCKDVGTGTFSPGKLDFTLGGSTNNITSLLMAKRDGSFLLALWNVSSIFRDQPQPGSDLALATNQTVTITLKNSSTSFTNYQTATPNNGSTYSSSSSISSNVISVSVGSPVLLVRIF